VRQALAAIRSIVLFATAGLTVACMEPVNTVNPVQRWSSERAIRAEVVGAYDLSKPHVVDQLMALYAPRVKIISASGGKIIASRDSIRLGLEAFWANVGRNMRNPKVEWTAMYIDVLSPTSAVMTATYRIPHKQPNGLPHVIGGAWTAVFEKRGQRWLIVQEHLSDNPFAS
jgi:ketosteroid isomerase-like protein